MASTPTKQPKLRSSTRSDSSLQFLTEWVNSSEKGIARLARRFPKYCPPGFAGSNGQVRLGPPENWREELQAAWRLPDAKTRRWALLKLLAEVAGNAAFQAGDWQTQIMDALFDAAVQADRLRTCEAPNCPAPLFMQLRRTQRTCGDDRCTAWLQRKFKLAWWQKHGEEWRDAARGGKRKRALDEIV